MSPPSSSPWNRKGGRKIGVAKLGETASGLPSPSPPAEKANASQNQAGHRRLVSSGVVAVPVLRPKLS